MNSPATANTHYNPLNLKERLIQALAERGLGEGPLSPEQLAPLDQFHTRGLEATVELAALCEIDLSTQVLDVGSGLGGPSRYLARKFGAKITGIDLSPSYVEAATYLAERSGLRDQVDYLRGNALELPFKDQSFDLVWTQHVAMNIADRAKLYRGIARVLKRGGRLAIFDVVRNAMGEIQFPLPWARSESDSFLLAPEAMKRILLDAGFEVQAWTDRSAEGVSWFNELDKKMAQASASQPPVSLQLAIGPDAPVMIGNLRRGLSEGALGLIQTVLVRA